MADQISRPELLQRSAFVGRRRELAELLAAVGGGSDSPRHLFLISGEPGIGKTRLLDELAAQASVRDVRVVWGRCWEGGGAPAYWPWIQIIRACLRAVEPEQRRAILESEMTPQVAHDIGQIVPELRATVLEAPRPLPPMQLDAEQARFRLFDSVTNLLKNLAGNHPMLVVLDDLHDGDHASLMMLRFAAREMVGAAIFFVATYRDAEVRRSRELGGLIGGLSREASSIPLGGLSEAEVARLIESIAGQKPAPELVARIYATTNGNPLFIDGIVRLLIAEAQTGVDVAHPGAFKVPGGVREAIRLRLKGLSAQENQILSVAAAIGNEFEAEQCRLVARVSADNAWRRLDEACAAGVVSPLGYGSYRFSHALLREALYNDIDTSARMRLHGRIGDAIESQHHDDLEPYLAKLAHHFSEAGIAGKAIDYSIRAGDAACAAFAYEAAVSHLETASAIARSRGADLPTRAGIHYRLGGWRFSFFEMGSGLDDVETALKMYEQIGDTRRMLDLQAWLGVNLSGVGPNSNPQRGLSHLRQAEALVRDDTEPQMVAFINWGLAVAYFNTLQIDEALTASGRAMEIYERLGMSDRDPWVRAACEHGLQLMNKGRHAQAVALFERIVSVASRLPDPDAYAWAMYLTGLHSSLMSDPTQAARFFRLGLARRGIPLRVRTLLVQFLAYAELNAGNIVEAERLLGENKLQPIPMLQAQIAFHKGDWKSARETVGQYVEGARRVGSRKEELAFASFLAVILRAAGDYERAASILQEATGLYRPGDFFLELKVRLAALSIALDRGRLDEAIGHLECCRKIMAEGEDWLGLAGGPALAEALVAAVQRRFDEASLHFKQAVEIYARYTLPWDQAATLHCWGRALAAAGDSGAAADKFNAAIDLYRDHHAGRPWIDKVEADQLLSRSARNQSRSQKSPHPTREMNLEEAVFRNEGAFWTIAYQGTTSRVKDAKGLRYIAYLLARPGEQIHVNELVLVDIGNAGAASSAAQSATGTGSAGVKITADLGDAGIALDPRAQADYRRRLSELRAELEEAENFHDLGRSERIRAELEFLSAELSASTGLGGRARRTSAHLERARVAVGKNIRAAIVKMTPQNAPVGHHLSTCIKTGFFCTYLPEPGRMISWQL